MGLLTLQSGVMPRRTRDRDPNPHVWVSQDQLHCAQLVAEFADGALSTPLDPHATDVMVNTVTSFDGTTRHAEYLTRPAGLVVGWQVRCDCYVRLIGDAMPPVQWHSGRIFTRVPSPELADPDQGRLFAADGRDINAAVGRGDVRAIGQQVWTSEHLDTTTVLGQLREAVTAETAARYRAASLAQAARAQGSSWAQIGDFAGMTRQSAQQRWGQRSSR